MRIVGRVGGDEQVSSPSRLSYMNAMQPKLTITCPPSVTCEEDRISLCTMPSLALPIRQTHAKTAVLETQSSQLHARLVFRQTPIAQNRCQRSECLLNEKQIIAQMDYIAFLENQI